MPAPNIFKLFRPRKGKPVSAKGMAEMLSATSKAWATLDCLGGYVDWTHGRPTIVPNGSSGAGAGGSLPYDLRIADHDSDGVADRIEIYIPTGDTALTSDASDPSINTYHPIAFFFGQAISNLTGDIRTEASSKWWYLNGGLPTDGNTNYIYTYITTDLSSTTDLCTVADLRLYIANDATGAPLFDSSTEHWRDFLLIGTVSNSGGNYTIKQYHRGEIKHNGCCPDALSEDALGALATYRAKSIKLQDETSGCLTLEGIETPTTPSTSALSGLHIAVREVVGGVIFLRWLAGTSLETIITELIVGYIPLDHEDELTGWLGGDETDGHWHLTLAEYSAITGVIDGTVVDHGLLSGLEDDDHNGGRTAATLPIAYIVSSGDETRNSMDATAYIGDGAATPTKSIWPHGRQLLNGATVCVDWILRKLSGGAWTITDTTPAGAGTGALVVNGGAAFDLGIVCGNNPAGVGATVYGDINTTTGAASNGDVNANGRVNAVEGFAFNGTDGWSGTFQVTQDGVTKDVTVQGGIITNVA